MTIRELAGRLHSHTRYNARKRGHELPFWTSTEHMENWLTAQPNWKSLYTTWVATNFDKNYTPSIDRLDNKKTYTIDNVELVTWEENNKRGRIYHKINMSKGAIAQYYPDGQYITTYQSSREARRITGVKNAGKVANKERKQAGGYIWKYVNKMPTVFEEIRMWASTRNLYEQGDPKTQALKLVEEVAELTQAVLKKDEYELIDATADIMIVLTNLCALYDLKIEELFNVGYDEISIREGKMINGTFVKSSSIKDYK